MKADKKFDENHQAFRHNFMDDDNLDLGSFEKITEQVAMANQMSR